MKQCISGILFLFVCLNGILAQDNSFVDSLKNELAKCKTSGDSVFYLCRITWNTSDDNAQEKFYYGNLALETAVKTDDKLKLAEAYDAAASGYRAVDSLEPAKALFQENINIGRENNFYDRIGFGSYNIAQILMKQDSLSKAVQYLKMSEEAFKKDNRKDMLIKLGWLFIKTDRKNQKANTEHLNAYLKSIINEKEDPNEKLFHYIDLANLYNNLGNRNQSIYYVQLAMDLAEKAKNLKGIVKSYYLIASYFRDVQQNYNAALSYYNKILEINESGANPLSVASLYNDIGYNYKLAGNDSMAIQYYNKSLGISKEQHHRHTMADAYRNIGEIYYISKEYDKALEYYQKCYTTGCNICPQIVFHPALVNIGNVYLLAHKPDSSFNYFQKAIALADSTNSTYELAVSYFNLAKYYDAQNETTKSLHYNHRALNLAKEANSLPLQKDITERLNQINFNQKNYQQAYMFLAASDQLKDSINHLNNVKNI